MSKLKNWITDFFAEKLPKYEHIEFANVEPIEEIHCFDAYDLFDFTQLRRPDSHQMETFKTLIKERMYSVDSFDLKDLSAINNSKSSERKFKTIYDFGKNVYDRELWDIDMCFKDLERNAIRKNTPLDIVTYRWNGIFAWDNHDGSHHMAAAIYQMIEDPTIPSRSYPALIRERYIDEKTAYDLYERYRFYAISSNTWWKLYDNYKDHKYINHEASRNNRHIVSVKKDSGSISGASLIKLLDSKDENVCIDLNKLFLEKIAYQKSYISKTSTYLAEN